MAAVIPHAGSFAQAAQVFNTIDWVPTWTSITRGTGFAEEGWYATLGDLVFFGYKLVLGTSPSFTASTQINGTLPVTADTTGLQQAYGAWLYRDDSATQHYSGTVAGFDTGGVSFCLDGAWDGTAPRLRVGNSAGTNIPVTPAVSDVISFSGIYRAA